jgi:hypothetical protein
LRGLLYSTLKNRTLSQQGLRSSPDESVSTAYENQRQGARFMTLTLQQVTKDLTNVDPGDLLSCWKWKVGDMKTIVVISVLGDLFLIGEGAAVYWLQTDSGNLIKVADSIQQFETYLKDSEKFDYWFLTPLVEKLIGTGKLLKQDEVYSYKKIPVIGGEYSVDNIEPTNMSVHFAISGQICEQIKDLPDGTKVSIKVKT